MASLLKNVAGQNITFTMVSSTTGAALTSATFTSLAWVTKDNSQAGFAGTFTTLGNGQYNYAPTQAETNCTDFGLVITVAGAVPVNLDFHTDTAAPLTGAQIATAVWQDTTTGDFTVSSSIGAALFVNALPGAAGGHFIAGSNAATTVNITGNITGNVTGSVGSVSGLTPATIATGVWQDATPGDFTTASSIGRSLYTSGILPGATGGYYLTGSTAITVSNVTQWNNSNVVVPNATGVPIVDMGYIRGVPSIGTAGSVGIDWSQVSNKTSTVALTNTTINTAAIVSGVWQDTTAGDFTAAGSIGKSLGGAFTALGTSVYSTASLVNAPTGGGGPTAAAIATAVWQDATPGDFTVTSSIGLSLYTGTNPGGSGGMFIAGSNASTAVNFLGNITGNLVGNVTGSVNSVTGLTTTTIAAGVWKDTTAGDFTVASSIGKSLYTTGATPGAAGGLFIAGANAATTGVAAGIWQDNTVGDFTTIGSIGRGLYTLGALPGGAGGIFIAGANVTTTVNFTGNLSGSVGSVSGSVNSVTGNVGGNVVGNVSGNVTGSVGSVVAAVAITSNIKRNAIHNGFMFVMTDSTTHAPKPGLGTSVAFLLYQDGVAASSTSTVTEVANGIYTINLTASDTNAVNLMLNFQATGADALNVGAITQP